MFKRKCDYCGIKFKRKDLRAEYGTDILLEFVSCKPCAIKNGAIWIT